MRTLLALLVTTALFGAEPGARIVVGPNYLVSRDGDVAHAETAIAVNPRDHQNLAGGAITATRPEGGWAVRTYASRDGGATWRYAELPEQLEHGGGDPQILFTPDGAAVFVSLAFESMKDEEGRPRGGMQIYRSEDGGFSWTKTQDICCSNDHPQMVQDDTAGRFARRIYIGTLYGASYPEYKVFMFRSDDGGRTFAGPVEAASGRGEKGINVFTPVVLSDGTLVVPITDFEFRPEKVNAAKARGFTEANVGVVTSTDGGVTFSAPKRVATIPIDFKQPNLLEAAGIVFAAADTTSTKWRDRIYMVWPQFENGAPRLQFTRSLDRGATWSRPRALTPDGPAGSRQYQPSIAVNRDGTLGITWYDTRHSPDASEFHVYFTASLDGGDTFLPPARVTSDASRPRGRGNTIPSASVYQEPQALVLTFLSAAGRWSTGGDYLGMAADRRGVFHPMWSDARTGTYQLYTAAIRVDPPPPPPPTDPEKIKLQEMLDARLVRETTSGERVATSLIGKVELVFDPTTMDVSGDVVALPLRLRNTSKETIYPPIAVEIVAFGSSWDSSPPEPETVPRVLNADNNEPGKGARFSFDAALGGDGELRPGMLSGPVPLRFRLVDPHNVPPVQLTISGTVRK